MLFCDRLMIAKRRLQGFHMKETPDTYQAFLLRLWRDSPQADWRLSLEDTRTGTKLGFPDGKQLLTYLETSMQKECPELFQDGS